MLVDTGYIERFNRWEVVKALLIEEYKKKGCKVKIRRCKTDTKGLYMYEVWEV